MNKSKSLHLDFPVITQQNNNPHSVYPVPQPRFEPAISLTHTTAFRPKLTCFVIQGILDYLTHYFFWQQTLYSLQLVSQLASNFFGWLIIYLVT